MKHLFTKPVLIGLALYSCIAAQAQKLPKIQNNSVRIPANLKIDGKATELNNTFQAYNPATSLYYTIANNDENLYLSVQATQPRIIAKILSSGITFVVNTMGKKKDNDVGNMTITYPDLPQNNAESIISKLGIQIMSFKGVMKKGPPDKLTDSIITIVNNIIYTKATDIKISGIKDIPDSTISIYNTDGIKTAVTMNTQQVYTYEMLVPLKLLGIPANQAKIFNYEIKLRSRAEVGKNYQVVHIWNTKGMNGDDPNVDLDSTTNFGGEYTLATDK